MTAVAAHHDHVGPYLLGRVEDAVHRTPRLEVGEGADALGGQELFGLLEASLGVVFQRTRNLAGFFADLPIDVRDLRLQFLDAWMTTEQCG